jgi:hypothetical protein
MRLRGKELVQAGRGHHRRGDPVPRDRLGKLGRRRSVRHDRGAADHQAPAEIGEHDRAGQVLLDEAPVEGSHQLRQRRRPVLGLVGEADRAVRVRARLRQAGAAAGVREPSDVVRLPQHHDVSGRPCQHPVERRFGDNCVD